MPRHDAARSRSRRRGSPFRCDRASRFVLGRSHSMRPRQSASGHCLVRSQVSRNTRPAGRSTGPSRPLSMSASPTTLAHHISLSSPRRRLWPLHRSIISLRTHSMVLIYLSHDPARLACLARRTFPLRLADVPVPAHPPYSHCPRTPSRSLSPTRSSPVPRTPALAASSDCHDRARHTCRYHCTVLPSQSRKPPESSLPRPLTTRRRCAALSSASNSPCGFLRPGAPPGPPVKSALSSVRTVPG